MICDLRGIRRCLSARANQNELQVWFSCRGNIVLFSLNGSLSSDFLIKLPDDAEDFQPQKPLNWKLLIGEEGLTAVGILEFGR
jgi:hypothetical protein